MRDFLLGEERWCARTGFWGALIVAFVIGGAMASAGM